MTDDHEPVLIPQDIPKATRLTASEISRLARIQKQSQNTQEGLGFVVEYKVGTGIQKPMFEDDDDTSAA